MTVPEMMGEEDRQFAWADYDALILFVNPCLNSPKVKKGLRKSWLDLFPRFLLLGGLTHRRQDRRRYIISFSTATLSKSSVARTAIVCSPGVRLFTVSE